MERGKFENKEVTFEEHIKREHSLWHYLFFIVYIKTKESTEFTGPESYVHDMINVRYCTTSCMVQFQSGYIIIIYMYMSVAGCAYSIYMQVDTMYAYIVYTCTCECTCSIQ